MYSVALPDHLMHTFFEAGVHISRPKCRNLAQLCAALALSPDCHLATLALHLPLEERRDSQVQRLRRQLRATPAWEHVYAPLVRQVMDHWQGAEVPLVMDRTDLTDRLSILTVGVAYGKRLLPLAWRILNYGGTGAEIQIKLLRQVQPYLPADLPVTFLGDAEFRSVAVQSFCRQQGWSWHLGLKSDTLVRLADGTSLSLLELPIYRGQRLYVQQATLTGQHGFGPVNIIADWPKKQLTPRFWATDQSADRYAWRRGRKRFWIEPTFRDWKSYGFDLERSQLLHPRSMDTMILAMAICTLWLVHVGCTVRTSERRTQIDVPHKRDFSLFRLGRDYMQRAQYLNLPVPIGFTVNHPAPK